MLSNSSKILIIGSMALLVACTSQAQEDASPTNTAVLAAAQAGPAASPADAGWIQLREPMRLPGLASVQSASTLSERLAKLSETDRQYVEAKNAEYFGVLDFGTAADQRKLVEQGFPMPEEWVAARSLPEQELLTLAQGGNTKAQMFYIDRVISEVAPVLKDRGFGDSPEDRALYNKFNQASAMSSVLLKQTRSPFAAYQSGLILSVGTLGHSPAIAAGSFLVAKELGDTRADSLGQRFFTTHASLDPQAVMASYSSIKSVLRP